MTSQCLECGKEILKGCFCSFACYKKSEQKQRERFEKNPEFLQERVK